MRRTAEILAADQIQFTEHKIDVTRELYRNTPAAKYSYIEDWSNECLMQCWITKACNSHYKTR